MTVTISSHFLKQLFISADLWFLDVTKRIEMSGDKRGAQVWGGHTWTARLSLCGALDLLSPTAAQPPAPSRDPSLRETSGTPAKPRVSDWCARTPWQREQVVHAGKDSKPWVQGAGAAGTAQGTLSVLSPALLLPQPWHHQPAGRAKHPPGTAEKGGGTHLCHSAHTGQGTSKQRRLAVGPCSPREEPEERTASSSPVSSARFTQQVVAWKGSTGSFTK